MAGRQAHGTRERSERAWNWTFWMAILALEAIGFLLSSPT